jgi:hypothetical protein
VRADAGHEIVGARARNGEECDRQDARDDDAAGCAHAA